MELRQIHYFLTVAEHGGFSQASVALGVTQPNISRQIKLLEAEWGWRLFTRSGRGVTLTPEGEVAHREMKKAYRVLQQGLKTMHRENSSQNLRIGYAPSLSANLLQQTIRRYSSAHPETTLSLHDLSNEELRQGIENGSLDAILTAEFTSDLITWHPVYSLPQIVVAPADHPLLQTDQIPVSALHRQRLLMFSRHDYPQYWATILEYCQSHQVNPIIAGEFDGIESLLTAMQAGLGIAILSQNVLLSADLTYATLAEPPPLIKVSTGIANYQAPSPTLQAFLDHIPPMDSTKNATHPKGSPPR